MKVYSQLIASLILSISLLVGAIPTPKSLYSADALQGAPQPARILNDNIIVE
ncbi:hypothetical protein BDV98DRAFT_605425 [Pterulicium gracile]|uniref:Uncharacterized protein n=1 Tax=Pterulicium gracile TaxID=1884261 RepID=A0A5C3QJD1_9AGAR|nr:hypothetical protein BDV98DRAFT_605425 [Pterula gracilis]